MKDLAIELIFLAMIVAPAIADSMQPAKALPPRRTKTFKRFRRGA